MEQELKRVQQLLVLLEGIEKKLAQLCLRDISAVYSSKIKAALTLFFLFASIFTPCPVKLGLYFFCRGNITKYIDRQGKKQGELLCENIRKIDWYYKTIEYTKRSLLVRVVDWFLN